MIHSASTSGGHARPPAGHTGGWMRALSRRKGRPDLASDARSLRDSPAEIGRPGRRRKCSVASRRGRLIELGLPMRCEFGWHLASARRVVVLVVRLGGERKNNKSSKKQIGHLAASRHGHKWENYLQICGQFPMHCDRLTLSANGECSQCALLCCSVQCALCSVYSVAL